jgi:hypothetical protein
MNSPVSFTTLSLSHTHTHTHTSNKNICSQVCAAMVYISQNHLRHSLSLSKVFAYEFDTQRSKIHVKLLDVALNSSGDGSCGDHVRWTAPEVLMNRKKHSEKSDVWSLGVTCWEMLGWAERMPYWEQQNDQELTREIGQKERELQKPEGCDEKIWLCIKQLCLVWDAALRSDFVSLLHVLLKLEIQSRNQLELVATRGQDCVSDTAQARRADSKPHRYSSEDPRHASFSKKQQAGAPEESAPVYARMARRGRTDSAGNMPGKASNPGALGREIRGEKEVDSAGNSLARDRTLRRETGEGRAGKGFEGKGFEGKVMAAPSGNDEDGSALLQGRSRRSTSHVQLDSRSGSSHTGVKTVGAGVEREELQLQGDSSVDAHTFIFEKAPSMRTQYEMPKVRAHSAKSVTEKRQISCKVVEGDDKAKCRDFGEVCMCMYACVYACMCVSVCM